MADRASPGSSAGGHHLRAHGFRADIQGIRAIAVIAVVLYHADVAPLRGGYVGVDVFFVVSGYLITSLLIRERDARGSIDLAGFYARRIRRLLPASALVLVVTAALGWLLMAPLAYVTTAGDLPHTALYVSNLRFAQRAFDYFTPDIPSAVQHYWSLAVEEQFYAVWPLIVLVGGRLRGRHAERTVLVAIGLASFAVCVVLTGSRQGWAFYLLPARAWELALGGVLALTPQLRQLTKGARQIAGTVGLTLVAWSTVALDSTTPFPGTAALLPVIGAALLIAAGAQPDGSIATSLLGRRPLVRIGDWSYSIYLWHWPLLVFLVGDGRTPPSIAARLAVVTASVVLAGVTERIVERPVRTSRRLAASRRLSYALAAAITVTALGVGVAARRHDPQLDSGRLASAASTPVGLDHVPADMTPSLRDVADDRPRLYADGCHNDDDLDPARLLGRQCRYGAPDAPRTLVLFGDSHAAHWFPAFERVATSDGWLLRVVTRSGCRSIDVPNTPDGEPDAACRRWQEEAIAAIAQIDDAVVVLSNSRGADAGDLDGAAWSTALSDTVARLESDVIVLGDVPRPGYDVPLCLSAHLTTALACAPPPEDAVDDAHRTLERETARRAGALFVDPTTWVCPGAPCQVIAGRLLVYRDGHHLTTTFAASLSAELAAAISHAGRRAS